MIIIVVFLAIFILYTGFRIVLNWVMPKQVVVAFDHGLELFGQIFLVLIALGIAWFFWFMLTYHS